MSPGSGHAIPGKRAVAEALRAGRRIHELLVDPRADTAELSGQAGAAGIPVREAARDELGAVSQGVAHQGVVARVPAFRYLGRDQIRGELVVVLDGVTDPQNLGAIARSAEAAGADALVLPKRRSVHVTPAAEKAAAGAFSWLDVALVPNLPSALAGLSQRGLWAVGLDGAATTTVWEEPLLDGPVALVVGAEGRGLSRLVAERCDTLVRIPLDGRVDSLNASAAAAVALFETRRRARLR